MDFLSDLAGKTGFDASALKFPTEVAGGVVDAATGGGGGGFSFDIPDFLVQSAGDLGRYFSEAGDFGFQSSFRAIDGLGGMAAFADESAEEAAEAAAGGGGGGFLAGLQKFATPETALFAGGIGLQHLLAARQRRKDWKERKKLAEKERQFHGTHYVNYEKA